MKRENIEVVMNNIIHTYENSIEKINEYLDSAKAKKIKVGENQDERVLQAIEEEKQKEHVSKLTLKCMSEVAELIKAYGDSETEFFRLKGEEITADAELLKMKLNETQVADLQKRYLENYTMLSQINAYAKEHNFSVVTFQTNRLEVLNSWNFLIKPRYLENTTGKTVFMSFLECAEKYKASFLRQIY